MWAFLRAEPRAVRASHLRRVDFIPRRETPLLILGLTPDLLLIRDAVLLVQVRPGLCSVL